jgi:hypothetical protein
MKKYFWNILISIDQFGNTVIGGDPDETISSRMGKRKDTCKVCYWLCKLLSVVDHRHCVKSIEADEGKDAL